MSKVINMTDGKPAKLMLRFALPVILTNLGQQLYQIVDAAIVGRGVGVDALAAVGCTDWTYWMITWSIAVMTQGFATFVSRYFGKNDPEKINKAITKRVLTELENLLKNKREEYTAFFKNFGPQLKEGTHEDYANAEKLRNLLLFETLNKPATEYSTLKEYVAAMPADQKEIYYMTGDSREYMESSPHIESFKKSRI